MVTLTEKPLAQDHFAKKELKNRLFDDQSVLLGYLLVAISGGLYGLEEYIDVARANNNFTIFLIHYLVALAFVVILLAGNSYGIRKSWRKEHIHKTVILLNLFLISAYALNREVPVFEDSVPWLCVYLILTSSVMMSYRYFDSLPKAINYTQHFLLGSAIILYLYLTLFVSNFYGAGSIGIIFFGIGTHIFVPLLLLIAAFRLLKITHEEKRVSSIWVVLGILVTVSVVTLFMVTWNGRVKAIDRLANQSVINADTELPAWMKVGQTIQNDWITERILKSRLIYTTSNEHFQWGFFPLQRNWDEKRKHNPLVFLASGNSTSSLSVDDRMNILTAITDSRHKAQERLWSGDNLSTSYIITDVDIYPELRIAYTEHYLNIHNSNLKNDRWWGNTEEAIYTFQLPEGSVVTSLSLWVNGKEEKAILTSKQKATTAYNTIVGREMRDPSVVHWQEGNTISVRVFPCTPQEERKFKIGITSPLAVLNDKVVYKNVTFRGPNAKSAIQTARVRLIGKSEHIDLPDNFEKNVKGEFISEGAYDADLTITMDLTPIKTNQFSFDGFEYSLAEASPTMANVGFSEIYLDINNTWTSGEIESLRPILKNYRVFAFLENNFLPVLTENWEEVTTSLNQRNFSLFPFHRVPSTDNAIIVTKGKELTPYLKDIETSAFAQGISSHFGSGKRAYVFNLEGHASTYIKSLKEVRALHFTNGNVEKLLAILETKTFPVVEESEQQVHLDDSHMVIQKKSLGGVKKKDNAPDHLARLFSYNDIMRRVGADYFKDNFVNDSLVNEAASAYVVSPISSLIVLETQEDYERFGIKDIENSLHNASKNSSGAVPEPHEWVLIIMFLTFIAIYIVRAKQKVRFV